MITDADEEQFTREVLLDLIHISEDTSYESLSSIFRNLSIYLSTLKYLQEDEKDKLIAIYTAVSNLPKMKEEDIRRDYQFISNTICSFVDFMKIRAPAIDLEPMVIKFYFRIFLEFLENFSLNIFDIPQRFQLKFDYILDRLGKSNLLSLMINIDMEDQIRTVINLLMKIEGDKRYSEKTSNFQNIFLIIKGLLEEVRNITIPMLNDILINFNKKLNFEKFQLATLILSEMKNILSAPTNQLVFHIISNDYNTAMDKKHSEILKLSSDDFVSFLKNLSKISNEYLINYLSSIPLNELLTLTKTKIKNVSHFEILLKVFATRNSLLIVKDYSQLFSNFLECFTQKTTKENDKFKIFRCLLKFLFNNNKLELKKNNFYFPVLDKIKNFLNEIKNEAIGMNVLNTISDKILKNKKIPKKILQHSQILLENKNQNLVSQMIELNFMIMTKKIFSTSSLFDLFSEEKRKQFCKLSFLLTNLLNKNEGEIFSRFKKEFEERILDLILNCEDKPKIMILLFFLSLTDPKANGILHKFFLECSDIFCVIFKHYQASVVDNLQLSPIKNNNISNISKISKRIENSKIKLEKESNVLKLIDDIKTDANFRENLSNLFEFETKNKSSIINKILNNFSENSKEDLIIFKKAFVIDLEEHEIYSLIEWGVLLMNNYDNDNVRAHEYLQCILSVFFYYLKLNINYIIIENDNNDDTRITQICITASYLKIFNDLIEFLKKTLAAKIKSKEVINYIVVTIRILNELKIPNLTEKLKFLILNDLSAFSLENHEISIKSLARLYYDFNRSNGSEVFLLPENFDYYLYESDKKLSAVKFITELLKIDRKNVTLNEILFKDNLRVFILDDLKNADENMYKLLICELVENPDDIRIKKDLYNLICMNHEIYKYEFYSINSSFSSEDANVKKSQEIFVKNIFNKVYELSNYHNDIDNIVKSKKKSETELHQSETSSIEGENLDAKDSLEHEELEDAKIQKVLKQLNNFNIGKYINLIFKHFDNGIVLKPNHQIKLMNMALYDHIFVRDHLLKKIEKCLKVKKTIYYNLHAIPITMIFLNDPDKALKKKANHLLAIFINHLLQRLNEYKDSEKNKNKNILYKYLPEAYLSYLLMYFIFNSNLNLILQSKETKYFQTIIVSYLKILKKITANKFDSNFLLQNCIKIKNISLKNKKVIKKISNNTYLRNLIKADNYSVTSENYELVKNEICNMVIKLINIEFTTGFKYDEYKPQIPIIFLTEKDLSLMMSNSKNERGKEENITFLNETVDLSKIENKFKNTSYSNLNDGSNNISRIDQSTEVEQLGMIKSSITKFLDYTAMNKSNHAVKDYKLRLEPMNSDKSKSIVENDFDEFENLPYYNKYKARDGEESEISHKEFEDGLDLTDKDQQDEDGSKGLISISKNKMFDEVDNAVKEIVNEELSQDNKKNKRRADDTKDKNKSQKMKKSKK